MGECLLASIARTPKIVIGDGVGRFNTLGRHLRQTVLDICVNVVQQFIAKWKLIEPKAVQAFQQELELTFTFYQFDLRLHL
jgi:hypothetical protein